MWGGGSISWGLQWSKSRIWGPFFDCHTTPPRSFELELENVTGNSPKDEDWRKHLEF